LEAVDRRHPRFHEKYVREYHDGLHHLVDMGFDVEEFKVPAEEVNRQVASSDPDEKRYGGARYVDRELFMAKLDAVLTYFELKMVKPGEPKWEIGFSRRRL
jgi:hypothetical protein